MATATAICHRVFFLAIFVKVKFVCASTAWLVTNAAERGVATTAAAAVTGPK